jgi:hypothetical protein
MLGVATRDLLRINEIVVEGNLEDSAAGRHDDDLAEDMLELGKNLFRQTDGSRRIASLSAVLDRDFHGRRV